MTKALMREKAARITAEANVEQLAGVLEALLHVVGLDHGSMCPANRCTCDLDETTRITAHAAAHVLSCVKGRAEG